MATIGLLYIIQLEEKLIYYAKEFLIKSILHSIENYGHQQHSLHQLLPVLAGMSTEPNTFLNDLICEHT